MSASDPAGLPMSPDPKRLSNTDMAARDLFGRPVSQPVSSIPARQLPLPLAWSHTGQGSTALFQISQSNRNAVRHIQRFAEWPTPASILVGPPQSGRSTLGGMFLAASGGELIDGLSGVDEAALFHAWNRAQSTGYPLLIIADDVAQIAAIRLPDLATRLSTAPIVTIDAPDPCLIRDLVDHLLVRRGLNPAAQLGSYVAARLDRSYAAVHAAVDAIDAASLATGRAPGIRIARAALIDAGLYAPSSDDSDSPE